MRNNLSPESAPWGREVDRRLASVENTLATLNQDSTNAFKSIASSLAQLSTQVSAVQDAVSQSGDAIARLNTFASGTSVSTTNQYFDSVVIPAGVTQLPRTSVAVPPNAQTAIVTVSVQGGNAARNTSNPRISYWATYDDALTISALPTSYVGYDGSSVPVPSAAYGGSTSFIPQVAGRSSISLGLAVNSSLSVGTNTTMTIQADYYVLFIGKAN